MRLSFDSIEEVKEFVKGLKGTRGPKGSDDEGTQAGTAPALLQPPAGGQAGFGTAPLSGFAPPAGGVAPMGGGFPAAGVTGPAPEVVALVNRIVTKVEAAVQSGVTKADDMVAWFRGQIGPEAGTANWDQIKVLMAKMQVPQLDGIAKLTGA